MVATHQKSETELNKKIYKWEIVWINIVILTYWHICGIYGIYVLPTAKFETILWAILLGVVGIIGHTAGSHRLWSHRSYRANLPLRIILAILSMTCYQHRIYVWARDHRVHHKYVDTDADPHNSTRGFFFSHIGWFMVKKQKEVIEKGNQIDLSDLKNDGVVMFQKKYFTILMPIFTFVIPSVIPWYFWGESGEVSYYFAGVARYLWSLHSIFLINSAAHAYGTKPYDKNIRPTENKYVGYLAMGEGWHNYHHTFPWDYKASEYGDYAPNLTIAFIDFFAWLGWARDLKTVSSDMVKRRILRTGDGTKLVMEKNLDDLVMSDNIWGWGDENMKKIDFDSIKRLNQ
nr:acyl-CoA Delta(11) desaturase-like [Onthophagus taurus]XP_022906576.1 acyl-CoA Delta(11) desaturase-like [Onthophagus taurus]